MLIAPNSTIRVLNGIDIDPDYQNTLYFASASAQATYFASKAKYSFTAQTYQRVNKNVVRVNRKADDMYDCCYMMFQNTSYGTKWFYAFIDKVEYVNDVTSNIYYHIDVIQTWLKDWTFKPCFVERMHTETDLVGGNITPEPLDTGEMVFNDYTPYTQLLEMAIILLVADMDLNGDKHGQLIDNCYSGCRALMFHTDANGIGALNARIENYNNSRPDAIVGMYMLPATLLRGNWQDDEEIAYSDGGYTHTLTLTGIDETDKVDGYTPRNKKLLTYPFNYLNVDNASGQSLVLRYEFFPSRVPKLKIEACRTQPVTVTLEPHNYKSTDREGVEHTLHTEILTLNGYPMCSWTMDSWKAWVAQNSLPLLADTSVSWAKTAVSAGIAPSMVNLPDTILEKPVSSENAIWGSTNTITQGGLSTTGSILSQVSRSAIKADVCRGNVNSGNVKIASDKQTFFYGRLSVNYQMASIIDSFFDKYGYAINKIITPNITSRPQWNYLKTIDGFISGNIPADDKKAICDILNRGITFWHNPANIGNYSLSNAPVT